LSKEDEMHTYGEAVELARMCARNARISSDKRVARELWKMAQEYQAEAAALDDGRLPDLGSPPTGLDNVKGEAPLVESGRASRRGSA
jgi:hypothetical protein